MIKEDFARIARGSNTVLCVERAFFLAEFTAEQVRAFDDKMDDMIPTITDDPENNDVKVWKKCTLDDATLNHFGHGHFFYKLHDKNAPST